jgi:hypothetical protein
MTNVGSHQPYIDDHAESDFIDVISIKMKSARVERKCPESDVGAQFRFQLTRIDDRGT